MVPSVPELTAAQVLRGAIDRAGLTVAAAAQAAGVARPLLQAYLAGGKQPSYARVQHIVASLTGVPRRPGEALARHRDDLVPLLVSGGATGAVVFGSVASGDDGPDSDLDILLQFPPATYGDVDRLARDASELLGVRVDLHDAEWLHPRVVERAVRSGRPL